MENVVVEQEDIKNANSSEELIFAEIENMVTEEGRITKNEESSSDERIFEEIENIVQEKKRIALQNVNKEEINEETHIQSHQTEENVSDYGTRETHLSLEESLAHNETQETWSSCAEPENISTDEVRIHTVQQNIEGKLPGMGARKRETPSQYLEKSLLGNETGIMNIPLSQSNLTVNETDIEVVETLSDNENDPPVDSVESEKKSTESKTFELYSSRGTLGSPTANFEEDYQRNDIEIESLSEYQFTLDPPESEQQRLEEIKNEYHVENHVKYENIKEQNVEADDAIWIHDSTDTTPKEFLECPYCLYKSKKLKLIHRHIADTHASVTCYKCQVCSYSHPQLSLVIEHITRRHQKIKHQCPECKIKFTTIWNCEGHILIRHPEKAQKLVKVVMDKRDSYNVHRRCPFCEFCSRAAAILKKHVERIHPEVLTYKCLYCNFKNVDVYDVADHMKDMHPEEAIENIYE